MLESSIKKIKTLHPDLQTAIAALVTRMAENHGMQFEVVFGTRTVDEQNKLYAQGRTAKGKVVTNARGGQSPHNYGLACDLWLYEDGKFVWQPDAERMRDIVEKFGRETEALGLLWGGRWKGLGDYGHVQLPSSVLLKPNGTPNDRCKQLYAQGGLQAVWAEVQWPASLQQVQPITQPTQPAQPVALGLDHTSPEPLPRAETVVVKQIEATPVPSSGLSARLEQLKGLLAGLPIAYLTYAASGWEFFKGLPALLQAASIVSLGLILSVGLFVFVWFKTKQSERHHQLEVIRENHAYNLTLAQLQSAARPSENTVQIVASEGNIV